MPVKHPLMPRRRGRGHASALRTLTEAGRLVGWREWFALPALGVANIEAKIDTGARTSALHVEDLQPVDAGGVRRVRFVPPDAREPVEVPVRDVRDVRNSSGGVETRYVIATAFVLGATQFTAEITLTSREDMTYNMLIGRSAMRIARMIVHPGRSFLQGAPRPTA